MPETVFPLLLIGIAAGFVDSTLGAGGLISVPSLIFLGFPPQVAIATDRLGVLGQTLTAFFKFWKAKKIVWRYVPALSVIMLAGSLIGANVLIHVNSAVLQKIIGVLILILFGLLFAKRDIGTKRIAVSNTKRAIGLILYFVIAIFGGFFGQGTGPLIFYTLIYFLGFTMLEVLATGIIPWFVLSVSSLVVFARSGIVDYQAGIILFIGMAVGGYIGAHVAIRKGDYWIKRLFILFVVFSGIKLLFF